MKSVTLLLFAATLAILAVTPSDAQAQVLPWRRPAVVYYNSPYVVATPYVAAYPAYTYPTVAAYTPYVSYYAGPAAYSYYAPTPVWTSQYMATPYYTAGYYYQYNPWTNAYQYRYGYYR
jgi:hypothetical protein